MTFINQYTSVKRWLSYIVTTGNIWLHIDALCTYFLAPSLPWFTLQKNISHNSKINKLFLNFNRVFND